MTASKRLHELIRQPFDLYRAGMFDEYIMGMINQPAQAMDHSITQEVILIYFIIIIQLNKFLKITKIFF